MWYFKDNKSVAGRFAPHHFGNAGEHMQCIGMLTSWREPIYRFFNKIDGFRLHLFGFTPLALSPFLFLSHCANFQDQTRCD